MKSLLLPLVLLHLLVAQVHSQAFAQKKQVHAVRGPVKVFILAGQSNMNGRGNIGVLRNKLTKDLPKEYPPSLLSLREDVWIQGVNGFGISDQKSSFRLEPGFGQWKWFGPELGFGHAMGDHFDQQVLLIKIIAGGTSLAEYWCSPTASKRTGRPIGPGYQRLFVETTTTLANLDSLYEEYEPPQGYQLMGFFWVHGNADNGPKAAEYEENLADLINDLRAGFGLPMLPVVVAESLSSRAPGSAFKDAVDRVNRAQGNQQAASILSKSLIDLRGEKYGPYKGASDSTHWLHNPRAFLDVGNWGAAAMKPLLAKDANHAGDARLQGVWKQHQKSFPDSE